MLVLEMIDVEEIVVKRLFCGLLYLWVECCFDFEVVFVEVFFVVGFI